MIHILFVCLGNICRSPMAEAIFRDLVYKEGLQDQIAIDSAGTGDWHIGHPPHEGTRNLLDIKGIDYKGIRARQVRPGDFRDYHYIFTMDAKNAETLIHFKDDKEVEPLYVGRLLDYVCSEEIQDVPDPYFTGNFDEVYDLLSVACQNALNEIKSKHHLL